MFGGGVNAFFSIPNARKCTLLFLTKYTFIFCEIDFNKAIFPVGKSTQNFLFSFNLAMLACAVSLLVHSRLSGSLAPSILAMLLG